LEENRLQRLVEGAKDFDTHALAELCEHFYPKIYRYMLYRVKSREDAEDLTGEVFVRMVKSLPKQRGSFPAWLYRIASNLVTDSYRRREVRKEVPLTEDAVGSIKDIAEDIDNSLLSDQLEQAVGHLTAEQQEVLRLKFIEGYDSGEIAEILGKSVGAIRALQFRALTALRQLLEVQSER